MTLLLPIMSSLSAAVIMTALGIMREKMLLCWVGGFASGCALSLIAIAVIP